MSQKDPWTHLRVRRRTLERLRAVAARLVQLHEQGTIEVSAINPEPKNPAASGLSDDALINRLLDEREDHVRRAHEQRTRRKRKGQSREDGQDTRQDEATD